MTKRSYHRLPGRSNGFLNSATLWEADDHLLLAESYRVSESYRRFFYRDIQAILICETKGGGIWTLVMSLVALILGGVALLLGSISGIVMGGFAGFFFLVALINFLQGPTCRCALRTAVQTQDLRSLNRVRTARKVLARLQPKIVAHQPEATPQ